MRVHLGLVTVFLLIATADAVPVTCTMVCEEVCEESPPMASVGNAFIHAQHDHMVFKPSLTTYMTNTGITDTFINEESAQVPYHTDGVASGLYCYVLGNDLTSDSTLTLRKNGLDTDMTVTIPAGSSGAFEDLIHSVSIESGDLISYKLLTGSAGTGLNYNGCLFLFTPDDPGVSMMKYTSTRYGNQTNWYPTWYNQIAWNTPFVNQTEKGHYKMNVTGTFKNLSVYATVNGQPTSTRFTLRKNSADTPLEVTLSSGSTGLLENLTDEVNVVVGDTVTLSAVKNTPGMGNLTLSMVSVEFITTDGSTEYYVGSPNKTINEGETWYTTFLGPLGFDSGPGSYEIPSRISATISHMRLYVPLNSLSGNLVVTLLKNQVPTQASITVAPGTRGIFEDSGHTVDVLATDKISYQLSAADGSGKANVSYLAAVVRNTDDP